MEEYLDKKQYKLPSRSNTPMQMGYQPELDISLELDATNSIYHQSLIGILRWMVELVRVDICLEVSILSLNLVLPRYGHLE